MSISISVDNLTFSYSKHDVLKHVSFQAEAGNFIAVLGPNGVGKSTLFKCILGILRGYTGKIEIEGVDASSISARELAHKVAYIPQSHGQVFNYSVLDMVLMGTSHSLKFSGVPRTEQEQAAYEALERAGIQHLALNNYTRLSGGEQQLVIIARALAQKTRILLMDEPTSALDYGNQAKVLNLVKSLTEDGYTILLSTHNPQQALWYADQALALQRGRLVAFGPSNEVVNEELIKDLYGMDVRFVESEGIKLMAPNMGTTEEFWKIPDYRDCEK